MTAIVGANGEVVIPARIRDRMGIQPGDLVKLVETDGGLRVEPVHDVRQLGGILADAPFDLTQELEADRRRERRAP